MVLLLERLSLVGFTEGGIGAAAAAPAPPEFPAVGVRMLQGGIIL
jgi:hypothetical protein